jgi:hypothetical protein
MTILMRRQFGRTGLGKIEVSEPDRDGDIAISTLDDDGTAFLNNNERRALIVWLLRHTDLEA